VAVAEHNKQQHNTHVNKQGFGCLSSSRLARCSFSLLKKYGATIQDNRPRLPIHNKQQYNIHGNKQWWHHDPDLPFDGSNDDDDDETRQ
jgi:hypothetical protein